MNIIDHVLDEIRLHVASHPPERGGAIYGPRGQALVTHFEWDANGCTSEISYVPSTQLVTNVARIECETGLEFKGIVHSHPRGLTRPSAGDEHAIASFFQLNPHIASVALPIVQPIVPGHAAPDASFISWYRAERRPASAVLWPLEGWALPADRPTVAILDEDLHVVPLHEHMRVVLDALAAAGLALQCSARLQQIRLGGATLCGLTAYGEGGYEFMLFITAGYPAAAPLARLLN